MPSLSQFDTLPVPLLRWMVDTEERFGYNAIAIWVPMVQAVFVPVVDPLDDGTGWRHLPLDEQVAFTRGLARGAKLGGITALMIAFGPVAADFQVEELI
jgi:hypothetical protein